MLRRLSCYGGFGLMLRRFWTDVKEVKLLRRFRTDVKLLRRFRTDDKQVHCSCLCAGQLLVSIKNSSN